MRAMAINNMTINNKLLIIKFFYGYKICTLQKYENTVNI